jgi:hypothetical protein
VQHSLHENLEGKLERKETKTGRSRMIELWQSATDVLRNHFETQRTMGYHGSWLFPK